MSTTTYVNFSAIDFKGVDSLSSYALDGTPLKFIPDLPNNSVYRVVWNFGDGTTSKSFSANKSYSYPGIYTVNLVVYNCDNNAMISTIEKTVLIVDYIPFTFTIYNSESSLNLQVGKIEGPFTFRSYYPTYQPISNIFYYITGSNSKDLWSDDSKFVHLENTYSVYDEIYNYSLQSNQFRAIDKLEFDETRLYARIDNGNIVNCLNSDEGSFFVGSSATKEVYLKDDSISDMVLYNFFFDKNNNFSKYVNNLGVTLSASIVNNPASYLSVTSNGLDGEGYTVDSFKLNPIKYFNTKIPFVVKIKDVDNFSIKNFDKIELSALNITIFGVGDVVLTDEGGDILLDEFGEEIYGQGIPFQLESFQYSISSLNYTLSSQNSGGAFRGFIVFNNQSSPELLQNTKIQVQGTFINDQLSSYNLSGESNYFNVYTKNYFDFYKKNENFDAEQTLKDLRFQETLFDKEVLFGDFLGGVLGDENADHESIGLKTYERISNFVQNTQDLDKCGLTFLNSLGQSMGYNDNREEKYSYPEKINRLMDTLSIDKSKLIGTANKFKENLDMMGRTSKDEFGVNIGNRINPKTYIVNADTPIVALEKFSNTYNLLNTYQPVSAVGSTSYHLSSYSSDWGWPMVLPNSFNFRDIDKYYIFFEYVEQYDNTVLDGVIDFGNTKTTMPSDATNLEFVSINGIYDNIVLDTLYQSLSL